MTALVLVTLASPALAQEHAPAEGKPSFQGFLFGDVTFRAARVGTDGFFIGQLVGHGNATLSNHLVFFGELSASARDSGYAFEVERAILRYDFGDALKVSAGRYHTPISYWNTAYHHGLWLQTSVARPEIIRIGGTFLPVHFVGGMVEGTISSSIASLTYGAGLGNGRGTLIGRGGDAGDANSHRATVFTGSLRSQAVNGLGVGASLYNDRVPLEAGSVDERIVSGHVVWDRGAPEVIAEYASVRHDGASGSATSEGYYVQAGLRMPGALWRLKPYARVETMNIAEADPVFTPSLADYDAIVAGLRWDFEALAALKAEFRREHPEGADRFNSLYLQLALVVPSVH